MKYVSTQITFREVPGLVTRCFSVSHCGGNCFNCHSPELRDDIVDELTKDVLSKYLEEDKDKVDCYVFLGDGDNNIEMLKLLIYCKEHNMKTCLYLGHLDVYTPYLCYLDYLKLGPYVEKAGGLECKTTNQRMYKIEDITSEFWKS